MTACDRAVRSVVVAGTGIVGLSAAIAFSRALPTVEVTVLETPTGSCDPTEQLLATLPTVHRFHAAIGFDELRLVADGVALHRLGTRFDHWSASGGSWFHTFAEHGRKVGAIPFHQVWLRAHARNRAAAFHAYSVAAVLAEAGRFAHPSDDPSSPLATYLYGLNLDPERYHARLDQGAAGLSRLHGAIVDIERREDGAVAALVLDGGRRVMADLFLDCTGPRSLILGRVSPGYEDWSDWLPCNHVAVESEPGGALLPFDRVTADGEGWTWTIPLPDRTLHARVCGSLQEAGSGRVLSLQTGRHLAPWIHNVVGLGGAAVMPDPLHGAGLHLAHSAILRAIQLLPGRDMHPLEVAEYNRRARLEDERVRDYLALHYARAGRTDTPFWRSLAERELPEGLARTLAQFKRRGRLPFHEEESFTADSWLAALIGLGVLPEAADPTALSVEEARTEHGMAAHAQRIGSLPARFPAYDRLVAGMRTKRMAAE